VDKGNITHGARKGNNGVDGLVDSNVMAGYEKTKDMKCTCAWSAIERTPADDGSHFNPGISP